MLNHPGPNPTVDIIVIKPIDQIPSVLLIRRARNVETEAGKLALPGGFIDTKEKKGAIWKNNFETEIQAARRELLEETGLDLSDYDDHSFHFLGIYDNLERDPRNSKSAWTESHVYKIEIKENDGEQIEGMDDAEEAKWYSFSELIVMPTSDFAFDHYAILQEHILG